MPLIIVNCPDIPVLSRDGYVAFFLGCTLSSILFVTYLSGLSHRINRSGLGLSLSPEEIIAYLKFTDDIFFIADALDALDE